VSWFIRKAFRLGPIRFNLSKSGIGASIGVRGLRVGQDARGRGDLKRQLRKEDGGIIP
jgi:hypothetical protein